MDLLEAKNRVAEALVESKFSTDAWLRRVP